MTKPEINIIVAIATDGAFGRKGDLLFHVSADLRHFKELTMGYPIIMGRKTFESLPKGALPGRRNIVVSRNASLEAPGAEVATSLENAIRLCNGTEKVFIIGGAQIYKEAIEMADRICLTRFDRTADDADCFFPEIDPAVWSTLDQNEFTVDEKTGVGYKFETLERIKK